MLARNIALGLFLILVAATTVNAVDEICVKKVKTELTLPNGYFNDLTVPAPDTRFKFSSYGNYDVIIKGYKKVKEFGEDRLYAQIAYCTKDTKEVDLELELHPGSNKNPGVGYPKITYEGPIPADPLVRCVSIGNKMDYSAVNNLFFSSAKNFETLLFRKVAARHVQQVIQNINRGTQPMVTNRVGNNPPRPLGEPDETAENSCLAVMDISTN